MACAIGYQRFPPPLVLSLSSLSVSLQMRLEVLAGPLAVAIIAAECPEKLFFKEDKSRYPGFCKV